MTCSTWATNDQHEWLEAQKAQFIDVNQRKAAAKDFFPDVVKQFWEKWPVPSVSQEETDEAGSVELATNSNARSMTRCVIAKYSQ
jgi:hypothetical protein